MVRITAVLMTTCPFCCCGVRLGGYVCKCVCVCVCRDSHQPLATLIAEKYRPVKQVRNNPATITECLSLRRTCPLGSANLPVRCSCATEGGSTGIAWHSVCSGHQFELTRLPTLTKNAEILSLTHSHQQLYRIYANIIQ